MSDLHDLFDRHLRGELNEAEMERLAELLDSDPSARKDFVEYAQWDTRFAEVLRESGDECDSMAEAIADKAVAGESPATRTPTVNAVRALSGVATLAIFVMIAAFYFQRPDSETGIAKVTGMSGSLQWTGDGGRIVQNLKVGAQLAGGTIEAMTPDSWFELEFNDGSTVAITGKSTLTFSDRVQKELHLKEGNMSSNVKPQPVGKPMLIHTRSAMLEVLGTQFEVEVGLSSTMLNVNKGKVRMKRLSDGSTVDVAAGHRVVAAADRAMSLVRVPDAVHRWKSQLHRGPDGTYGKWAPGVDQHPASLKAIPFVPGENPAVTLSMVGLRVVRADTSPVILKPGSRFIARGRLATSARVFFGIRMAHPNGEFAGKFRADRLSTIRKGHADFEILFQLSDFKIDPCVRDRKDELPSNPEGLVVTGVWSFTIDKAGKKAGLEITEIELIPPEE